MSSWVSLATAPERCSNTTARRESRQNGMQWRLLIRCRLPRTQISSRVSPRAVERFLKTRLPVLTNHFRSTVHKCEHKPENFRQLLAPCSVTEECVSCGSETRVSPGFQVSRGDFR